MPPKYVPFAGLTDCWLPRKGICARCLGGTEQAYRPNVLLGTIIAMSDGLQLTKANHVIIMERYKKTTALTKELGVGDKGKQSRCVTNHTREIRVCRQRQYVPERCKSALL